MRGDALDRRTDLAASGDTWPASPVQRAETWCRESGTPLALVTDDDSWTLVWAPRGAPAASGTWTISDLADETILQSGLVSLLGARRFFAVSDEPKTGETLERLFERAADAEAELTKGLGASVRQSVELLVAAISRDHVASDGKVLADVAGTEVYESAVTVLMRLVFLLFAEERRLLPAEDPLWAESYSVLTLRDDLRQAATRDGLDALERRSTAWHRLLATFRAVHGGVNHDRLTLPAYGGSLFDPDRFPFLEGRRTPDHLVAGGVDLGPAPDAAEGPGRPVAIDDRTVLAILDSLLTVQVKSGRTKVAQRVSYKALDVEQIGHCYEGLLDHGAIPIDELALGLVGPEGGEPEITVDELEAFDDWDDLCEWLSDKTRCNKKASALAKLLDQEPEGVELARLRVACGHDDDTVERVLPYWGLIRPDLRGLPVVLLPGSMFVTQTTTRRNMGAQYTTKALAEEVVQYALEPLVYDPGPQNEPDQGRWKLKTPAAILDLRVCDPAVGSGAILTAAGRYLADRLVESVIEYGAGEGLFASRLHDLVNAPAEEQTVLARREIVDHCLYGVDKNPVAAEMAKLSLWLTTMARERPFTFLDHAIQVGDSLLGITDIDQLRWLHLDPSQRQGKRGFESLSLELRLKDALELARELREMSVFTVRDAKEKQRLNDQLRASLLDLSLIADVIVGAAVVALGTSGLTFEERVDGEADEIRSALDAPLQDGPVATSRLSGTATAWLRTDLPDQAPSSWDRECLHWPLVFPEVFLRSPGEAGFDAIVGNPPFLGGTRISGALGKAIHRYLGRHIADATTDRADLVSFFFLRAAQISKNLGLLATNSIARGDTRAVGLVPLEKDGWLVHRAVSSEPWPNEATLEIAKVWMVRSEWTGRRVLDGRDVREIGTSLSEPRRVLGDPRRLAAYRAESYQGTKVTGMGFVLDPETAEEMFELNPRNMDVVRPYYGGKDVNDSPSQSPSRFVIDVSQLSEEAAAEYFEPFRHLEVEVKPERQRLKSDGSYKLREPLPTKWWVFGDRRRALYEAIRGFDSVLVVVLHSPHAIPVLARGGCVYSHALGVFPYQDVAFLGLLSSAIHWWWVVDRGSTLGHKGNIRYTPTDVFDTFAQPSPRSGPEWERIGAVAAVLQDHRATLMTESSIGVTKTYNRVHAAADQASDIARLRDLHIDLDHAVRDAYGWSDLELDHHHWETPQGMRFTVSPEAKDEILDRLLELNHERYAEEVAAGLHDKKATKSAKRATKKASKYQGRLL